MCGRAHVMSTFRAGLLTVCLLLLFTVTASADYECPACGHSLDACSQECPGCGASLKIACPSDRLEDFAVVGYSSVSTSPGVKILPGTSQAGVGSNGMLCLHQDNVVGTETYNTHVQAMGDMWIGGDSVLFGSVAYNGTLLLDSEGTGFEPVIYGGVFAGDALEIELPACDVTVPGGPDLSEGGRTTHTFTDGDSYGNFSVGPHSTLLFPGGVYSFQSLHVGQESIVELQAPVEVHVADALNFEHGVHHILTAGSAEQVLWLLGDGASFTTGDGRTKQTELFGTYCGPGATVSLGQDYVLTGALCADAVSISHRTVVNSSTAPLSPVCPDEEHTIFADETIEVGTAVVGNTPDDFYINIDINNDWYFSILHIFARTSPVPLDRRRNPDLRRFPYIYIFPDPVNTFAFSVDLGSLNVDCAEILRLAVHFVMVQLDGAGNVIDTKEGWMFGDHTYPPPSTSWGWWDAYEVCCE